MTMTPTERVRNSRARKKLKSVNVTEDTLVKLQAYRDRWELPNLSVAINHALVFAKPE